MLEKLYTVDEVAEAAAVTPRTIRNYLKNGRLVGRKIGGQWRFPESEVRRLLSGEEPTPVAPPAQPVAPPVTQAVAPVQEVAPISAPVSTVGTAPVQPTSIPAPAPTQATYPTYISPVTPQVGTPIPSAPIVSTPEPQTFYSAPVEAVPASSYTAPQPIETAPAVAAPVPSAETSPTVLPTPIAVMPEEQPTTVPEPMVETPIVTPPVSAPDLLPTAPPVEVVAPANSSASFDFSTSIDDDEPIIDIFEQALAMADAPSAPTAPAPAPVLPVVEEVAESFSAAPVMQQTPSYTESVATPPIYTQPVVPPVSTAPQVLQPTEVTAAPAPVYTAPPVTSLPVEPVAEPAPVAPAATFEEEINSIHMEMEAAVTASQPSIPDPLPEPVYDTAAAYDSPADMPDMQEMPAHDNFSFEDLSDVGKRVAQFVSEVHDCSAGPQVCSVIELYQSFASAKITSERLTEIATEETQNGATPCASFVEFDARYYVARYTLFGSSTFLSRCLTLLG